MTIEDLRAKIAQRAESRNATQPNEAMRKAVANAAEKWKASQISEPEVWEQYGVPKYPAQESGLMRAGRGANIALTKAGTGLKGLFADLSEEDIAKLRAGEAYMQKAGLPATLGGLGVDIAAEAAAMTPMGKLPFLARIVGAGGTTAALSPENRGEAAMYGAGGQVGGEGLGKVLRVAAPYLNKVYEGAAGMFHAPTAAAQTLGKFADVPGRTIPETVDLSRTYKNIPELKPTLGMMVPEDQRTLLEFENYVRTKFGKTALAEADLYNNQVIRNAIADKALDPKDAALAMEALNAETGALRKTAFEKAREKSSAELAAPILRQTSEIRTRPGETGLGSPAAQTQASEIESIALGPVSKKSVIGAGGLAVDVPVFARKVDPANLYAARKTIDDVLRGAPGPNDELKNAIKANKVTSMELKGAIDEALNHASNGEWDKYLTTYIEKIKPIEEGKAFQNVLSRFENASRIPGTNIPKITPGALRKAADETYKDVGAATVSKISPESRLLLRDAERAMGAIENAQSGLTAASGSPSASRLYEMFRTAPKAVQPVINAGLAAVNILTKNKSQEIIVDALQNPQNFQAIVDRYNKMNKVPISPAQAKGLQVLLGSVGAGAAQQGRR